jgi:hypothetical protein
VHSSFVSLLKSGDPHHFLLFSIGYVVDLKELFGLIFGQNYVAEIKTLIVTVNTLVMRFLSRIK